MSAELIARTIMFVLAPVVMVNASAQLLNGLLGYYAAVDERMRRLAHERLELLRVALDALAAERLQEIDLELPDMVQRHRATRDAILLLSVGIVLYVVTMLLIGLAAFGSAWVETLALAVFFLGTATMLAGVLVRVQEIRSSHRAVMFEIDRIRSLPPARPDMTGVGIG